MTATLVRVFDLDDRVERYSTRAVAEVVGYPVNHAGTSSTMTRWREELGLSRHGSGCPARWSLRHIVAIDVAAPYVVSRGHQRRDNIANVLAHWLAHALLATESPWVFVTVDLDTPTVVEVPTLDDLVAWWHTLDTPTGVVVDVAKRADDARARLGVVLARHGLPNPYPTHEGATP